MTEGVYAVVEQEGQKNLPTFRPLPGFFERVFSDGGLKVNGWVFRSVIHALYLYSFQNVIVNSCVV